MPLRNRPTLFGRIILGLILILTVLLSVRSVKQLTHENQRYSQEKAALKELKRLDAFLGRSQKEMNNAARKRSVIVARFLIQRKTGLRPFADALLSWRGKLKFVQTKLRDENQALYRNFIQEQFAKYLFSEKELLQVIQQAILDFERDVQVIENQLWVTVQKDIADMNLAQISNQDFKSFLLQQELDQITPAFGRESLSDIKVSVAREAGFWSTLFLVEKMTTKVSAGLAAKFGLSAVIKSSGLVSGSITLGTGILAGFALDAVMDRLIRSFYDPSSDLAIQTDEAMNHMIHCLLQGDARHPGLLLEFDRYCQERVRLWRLVLKYQVYGLSLDGIPKSL